MQGSMKIEIFDQYLASSYTYNVRQKVVYGLSNGAIFNDSEQSLTQFSIFDAEYL